MLEYNVILVIHDISLIIIQLIKMLFEIYDHTCIRKLINKMEPKNHDDFYMLT